MFKTDKLKNVLAFLGLSILWEDFETKVKRVYFWINSILETIKRV